MAVLTLGREHLGAGKEWEVDRRVLELGYLNTALTVTASFAELMILHVHALGFKLKMFSALYGKTTL